MEIGGFFEKQEVINNNDINKNFFEIGDDNLLVMSGRTAIDIVIQDIIKNKTIKTVYFPSYSCNSMRDAFSNRGIKIEYYDVFFDGDSLKYKIDVNKKCDVFFAMNYFGYSITNMDKYIKEFKKRNIIVVEDITHSLLSKMNKSEYSDYYIASLRKWFPIYSGGIASKNCNKFKVDKDILEENEVVVKFKKQAMLLKEEYSFLENDIDKKKDLKNTFSSLYKESNKCIESNYINKKMDKESIDIIMNIDIEHIKEKIKLNVKTIYENLKRYKFLISKEYNEDDCLLYVPLYIEKNELKRLKEIIYKEEYYCPSHWPILPEINDLFENELSLVCDYRYSPNEIVSKILLINEN